MEVIKTPLDGVLMFNPRIFGDKRGCFVETWQEERYREAGVNLGKKSVGTGLLAVCRQPAWQRPQRKHNAGDVR